MKLRNTSARPIKIKFLSLDSKIKPEDRDVGAPTELALAPNQVGDVSDLQWDKLKLTRPYKQWLQVEKLIELGSDARIIPGDGDADCELCYGRGFVSTDSRAGQRCQCVYKRDVIANVRKIWPGYDLFRAPVLKKRSVLRNAVEEDSWITSEKPHFRSHLRQVASRQGPGWFARVRSDTDMMAGWFASAKAKSIEIFDADVSEAIARDMDIQDLAEPPDLLIMILGVKRARNVATPEVLMEVLSIREHVGKPTWVVDQPSYCIEHEAHRCNSAEVLSVLETFHRVALDAVRTIEHEPEPSPEGVEDTTFVPTPAGAKPSALLFHKPATGKTTHEPINSSEDD